jgi:hypothetical protein
MAGKEQTLYARRNTPFFETFEVLDPDGAPRDLTGHTGSMEVRLYGMQTGDPLIRLETVTVALTHGLQFIGSGEVTAYSDELQVLFLPEGAPGADVRFSYDLVLSDADGFTWVERYGEFEVTDGVGTGAFVFLSTDTGALLTTADGALLEIV